MTCANFSFLCQLGQLEQVAMGLAFDHGRLGAVARELYDYDERHTPVATSAVVSRIRALRGVMP
jgi:hypothetical protein